MPNPSDVERKNSNLDNRVTTMLTVVKKGAKQSWSEIYNSIVAYTRSGRQVVRETVTNMPQNVRTAIPGEVLGQTLNRGVGIGSDQLQEAISTRVYQMGGIFFTGIAAMLLPGWAATYGSLAAAFIGVEALKYAAGKLEDQVKGTTTYLSSVAYSGIYKWWYGTSPMPQTPTIEDYLRDSLKGKAMLEVLLPQVLVQSSKPFQYCDDVVIAARLRESVMNAQEGYLKAVTELKTRVDLMKQEADTWDTQTRTYDDKVKEMAKSIFAAGPHHWQNTNYQYFWGYNKCCSKVHCYGPGQGSTT
jgi:hypothetical protein